MAIFIDNLAYALFVISFAGFMLLYTIISIYLNYLRKGKDFTEYVKAATIPLSVLALYMIISGFWGQFTWPLPGSYNILFYDPFISFGLIIFAFVMSIRYNTKISFVGFLSLMIGVMVIIYGIVGYNVGLTSAPLALLGMYFMYGIAAILGYPVSFILETKPGIKKEVWKGWSILLGLFILFLFIGSCLAAFVGISAIPAHLFSAP